MRRFNITGLCVPEEDYMVDISPKINEISKLIGDRAYFTINRPRQYGKTTLLSQLYRNLSASYTMLFLSFEGLGDDTMATESGFCRTFMELVQTALFLQDDIEASYADEWVNENVATFHQLGRHMTKMTKGKKLVLMIDEVDRISHNRVFLHFLGLLRQKFLARKDGMDFTFHSVILTGVYDIKNIKLKLINEGSYTPSESENKLQNSPWNIATAFRVDMHFKPAEIATMLTEYEIDHQLGLDIPLLSQEIYRFTSGYPVLVSTICKIIDEQLNKQWTLSGVHEAVKLMMREESVLQQDLTKNLHSNQALSNLIYDILILGRYRSFFIGDPNISLGVRYGYLQDNSDSVKITNKIFEVWMSRYFIAQDEHNNSYGIQKLDTY